MRPSPDRKGSVVGEAFLPIQFSHTAPGTSDHRLAPLPDDSVVMRRRFDDSFNTIFEVVLRGPDAADSLTHEYRQPRRVGQEDTDNSCNDDSDRRRGPHMGRLVGKQEAYPSPDCSEEYDREGNPEEGMYGGLDQVAQ